MLSNLWAVTPNWLDLHGRSLLQAYADPSQLAAARRPPAPEPLRQVRDKIAIIPIHGAMSASSDIFSMLFGGASTGDIRRLVKAAAMDKETEAIILHVSSPGGAVDGVDALSEAVRQAASIKPVMAHIDSIGASRNNGAHRHRRCIACHRFVR